MSHMIIGMNHPSWAYTGKRSLLLQQMWWSSLIKRHRIYLFTIILTLCSLALSNEEKTDIIEVKLNVSPGRIDGREWIPFQGGSEISNKEFWQLLDNEQHVDYWSVKEKEMKDLLYKRPIKFLIYVPLSVLFTTFYTKKTTTSSSDNFGTYEFKRTEYNEQPWLGLPFIGMSIYELYKWFRISLPIKDPVSFYDIKPLVEDYNKQLVNNSGKTNNE